MSDFRSVTVQEAETLVKSGAVQPLDVRTREEYALLGHIPGAWLLPIDIIAAGPAVVPRDGRPVLVYCEHGVRSVYAARFLADAGVATVLNLADGMSQWTGPRDFGPGPVRGPSRWLLENAAVLPREGEILDVACGRGRHALLMAAAGFRVTAVDNDREAVEALRHTAERLGLPIALSVMDLESGDVDLGPGRFDAVVVFNYLHRPLMPALVRALRPGGVLVYETFTARQAERGHPKRAEFLLDPGELPRLVAPLSIERSEEGEVDGKFVAAVVARAAR